MYLSTSLTPGLCSRVMPLWELGDSPHFWGSQGALLSRHLSLSAGHSVTPQLLVLTRSFCLPSCRCDGVPSRDRGPMGDPLPHTRTRPPIRPLHL